MIIIAYDHDSRPISIVIAKNEDAANAYWQGQGRLPHCIKVIKSTEPAEGTVVNPILKTKEVEMRGTYSTSITTVLIVDKE